VVSTTGSPAVVGQAVTYTATVSVTSPGSGTPTGNVEFFDAGTAISTCGGATGEALGAGINTTTCVVTYTASGSHTITVKYLGTGSYNASATSTPAITESVNAASTTAAVVSTTGTPSVVGQAVTYTATVTPTAPSTGTPTGNVEFLDGGTAITGCGGATGEALGAGVNTTTCVVTYTATGAHTITAKYLGATGSYTASAVSATITQTVNKASTATALSSSNTNGRGTSVLYTATVSVTAPGSGTIPSTDIVTFDDNGTAITCGTGSTAFNGTTATCKSPTYPGGQPVGHSITAVFNGDTNFATSTSNTVTETE
jgi:hypothetical protein